MRRVIISCLMSAFLLCWTTSAYGGVVYKDVADLAAQAEQIVIGDVVEVTSFWDANYDLIKSRIIVNVTDYLVGEGPGTEVLTMSGGEIDGYSLRVSVLPVFEVGDHVLLYLGNSEIRLVESFQGAYLTDGELIARMAPACGRILADTIQPLSEHLSEIEQALPSNSSPRQISPYKGTFKLPVANDSRYALCGYDWSYYANPMGEDYRINANCSDSAAGDASSQRTQIQNAAAAWNNAGANFEFTYGGTSTSTSVTYNGTNLLYFDNTPPDGGSYVAATYIWAGGGDIDECDLVFNDRDYTWWNGSGGCSYMMDIWNISTHEFGHFLCLDDLYGGGDSDKTMYGYVSYCDTHARTLHSDDINGIIAIYGSAQSDNTPPNPNPMTFSLTPYPIAPNQISMVATTATDSESPPVQYYFDFYNGGSGGTDSGWQSSTSYTDSSLSANTNYTYRVKARDSAPTPNETSYSSNSTTATDIQTPTGVLFGSVTATSIELNATGTLSNLNADSSGAYFDSTTSGGDGGINNWIQTTADQATGLSANTLYTFRVKARNRNAVETSYSSSNSKATLANTPSAPTLSSPTSSTMNVNVNPNGNPSSTVFAIRCTATNPSDPTWNNQYIDAAGQPSASTIWRTDSQWGTVTATGLEASTDYTFAVKARNQESVETAFGPGATQSTSSGGYSLGDLNCDGSINSLDIDPFVLAMTSAPSFDDYYAQHPDCDAMLADCNEDGSVNSLDVDPFVSLLS